MGTFRTVDFDPGPSVIALTGPRVVTASARNILSARSIRPVSSVRSSNLDLIARRGAAVGGPFMVSTSPRFLGTADFDPGPGLLQRAPYFHAFHTQSGDRASRSDFRDRRPDARRAAYVPITGTTARQLTRRARRGLGPQRSGSGGYECSSILSAHAFRSRRARSRATAPVTPITEPGPSGPRFQKLALGPSSSAEELRGRDRIDGSAEATSDVGP